MLADIQLPTSTYVIKCLDFLFHCYTSKQVLWPNGTFIIRLGSSQGELDDFNIDQKPSQSTSSSYGDKVTRPSSFEAQLEAARRADDVKKMLLGETLFPCNLLYDASSFCCIPC